MKVSVISSLPVVRIHSRSARSQPWLPLLQTKWKAPAEMCCGGFHWDCLISFLFGVDFDCNFVIQMSHFTKEEFVHILRCQSTGFVRGSSKYSTNVAAGKLVWASCWARSEKPFQVSFYLFRFMY